MKIYLRENVLEAALNRIRWLFDEFPEVVVNVSGGKDSTVVFHLAMQVAKEKGRLPLKVLFIDQEAEWQATIDQIRLMMESPDVTPLWFQIPFKLFNATSTQEHWLRCWAPEDEDRWMRQKETYSIKENVYEVDRFVGLFGAIIKRDFAGKKTVFIAGVRAEESPRRALGLTTLPAYKWATWGKSEGKKGGLHYTMYPIYDWSYGDVWKAIHEHGWPYNRIYDAQYAHGIRVLDMRVSNVHHETAVAALFYMQEAEPETYQRLTQRISGIDMAGKMGIADYFPKKLPFMFADWREYRDFLLEKLIEPGWREKFRATFDAQDKMFAKDFGDRLYRTHITGILTNDWEQIKSRNFATSMAAYEVRKRLRVEKNRAEEAAA